MGVSVGRDRERVAVAEWDRVADAVRDADGESAAETLQVPEAETVRDCAAECVTLRVVEGVDDRDWLLLRLALRLRVRLPLADHVLVGIPVPDQVCDGL